MEDRELLTRYASEGSDDAFRVIVERHVDLVYSCALRLVRNPTLAEDVTQAVFVLLARKGSTFSQRVVLAGWLHKTTTFVALKVMRSEMRRALREKDAVEMQHNMDEPAWKDLAPILDEALQRLGEADRNAILLRYFQNKGIREVGQAMRISEDAAQKRVNRAVEKLRVILTRRQVALPSMVLIGVLSSNAAQAAPVGLCGAITASVGHGIFSAGAGSVIQGATKALLWSKLKMVSVGAGIAALFVTVAVLLPRENVKTNAGTPASGSIQAALSISPPQLARTEGQAEIRVILRGAVGIPFELNYMADNGPAFLTNGVMPAEVVFWADAFQMTISPKRVGALDWEIKRDGVTVSTMSGSGSNAGIPEIYTVECQKGGRGIRAESKRGEGK